MIWIAAADGATAADLGIATTAVLAAQLVQGVCGSVDRGDSSRLVSVQVADEHGTSFPLHFLMMAEARISEDLASIESAANKLPAALRGVLEPAIAQLRMARTADNPDLCVRAGAQWRQAVQRLMETRVASEEVAHVHTRGTDEDHEDVELVVNTLMAVFSAQCPGAAAAAAATRYLLAAAEATAAGILTAPLPVHPFFRPNRETLAGLEAAVTRLRVSCGEEAAMQPILWEAQLAAAVTGVIGDADEAGAGAARKPTAAPAPVRRTGAGAGCGGSAGAGDDTGM